MVLSRGARRTLQALHWFFNGKTECWPRQQTIARRVGCGLRSVKRYLDELRDAGVIESHQRPNSACVYHLVDCKELALPEEIGTPGGTPVGTPTMKEVEVKPLNTAETEIHALVTELLGEYQLGGYVEPFTSVRTRAGILPDAGTLKRIALALGTIENFAEFRWRAKEAVRTAETWGLLVDIARETGTRRKPQGSAEDRHCEWIERKSGGR